MILRFKPKNGFKQTTNKIHFALKPSHGLNKHDKFSKFNFELIRLGLKHNRTVAGAAALPTIIYATQGFEHW